MDSFLKNKDNLKELWHILNGKRLPGYADEIIRLAKSNKFYLEKFNERPELKHIIGMDRFKEEIANLTAEKSYDAKINLLKNYSHYLFLRSVLRLANGANVEDISYEYNDFSDLFMVEIDKLIKEKIGNPPADYSVVRLGSKGRIGSDLYSDFDVALVYSTGLPVADSMYFELYASRFFNLFRRFEYLVDFPIAIENSKKKQLVQEILDKNGTMYHDKGRCKLQNMLGRLLTGDLKDYEQHICSKADNVERTAILDIRHVIGNEAVSQNLVYIVKLNLLENECRLKFLQDLKQEFGNDKGKATHFGAKMPDLKKDYGGILTITKLGAYLKALMSQYYTDPHLTFKNAQKSGIITLDDEKTLIEANRFLRSARNWIHIRSGSIADYVEGRVKDNFDDPAVISADLGLKPNQLIKRIDESMGGVQGIVEKVVQYPIK